MNIEQNEICQYLTSWPGQFVSRKEICRRAGGKWRYREDENWALPILQRMVEERIVETDETGHFRLIKGGPNNSKSKRAMWISPAIRSILKQSGREFVIDLDKDPETTEPSTNAEPLNSVPDN